MAVTVKKAVLGRKEIDNRPGMLAKYDRAPLRSGCRPASRHGLSSPWWKGYGRHRTNPVSGRKSTAAAKTAGLAASPIPALLAQGDNRQGLGHALTKAIGDAGINLSFVMAQVVGRRYSAMLRFENEADAARAAHLVKKAAAPVRKR